MSAGALALGLYFGLGNWNISRTPSEQASSARVIKAPDISAQTADLSSVQAAPKPLETSIAPSPTRAEAVEPTDESIKRVSGEKAAIELRARNAAATQIDTSTDRVSIEATVRDWPDLRDRALSRLAALGEQERLARELKARTEQIAREAKVAEQAADASIATETDRTKLASLGASWPNLKYQADARTAALDAEQAAQASLKSTKAIQDGLRRAGCFEGPSTGAWSASVRKAAEDFNKHAAKRIALDKPAPETEAVMGSLKGRVCPVKCQAPKVAVDNTCVLQACETGLVRGTNGVCEPTYVAFVGLAETRDAALVAYNSLTVNHPDVLGGATPDLKTTSAGTGVSIRLGPGATKDAIKGLCSKLRGQGFASKCYAAPL